VAHLTSALSIPYEPFYLSVYYGEVVIGLLKVCINHW